MITGVVFDLGGVVLESPLDEIARFEGDHGLPAGVVNAVVVASGHHGAWARLERGELDLDEFVTVFASEFGDLNVDTGELMRRIDLVIRPRPRMLAAVDRLRGAGLRVAALTNNWHPFPPDGLPEHFDVFVESVREGTRKPEPDIYRRCLDRLGLEPHEVAMLDDLGPNLKPARAMGMTTIKFETEEASLRALSSVTGVAL